MTNKFQIPNRDFVIWELAFYHSTWPHYTHKLIGSGYKPEPACSRGNAHHREKWRVDYADVDGGYIGFISQLVNTDTSDWTTDAWNATIYWYMRGG
ncbi:MAG: hypothetical protein M5U24_02910 [Candidatus Kuenenia sp.]|uniref:hypothetical protein n=1 Tax=Candidatus Kuenenia sp. TaxID=2499824 RepID=UPI0022BCBB66|nr:hypothetical protein [Candidatus Kuenenia sp.]MCZ7621424.1 hypothetical protein [Candidatus Kuenenia sp.]